MNPIVITPEQLETIGPKELSERIVQGIAGPDIVDLVGIGSSIPSVIAAVDLSKNIANVNINSVTLDNIPIPVYGNQEAIFFELSRKPEPVLSFIEEFEAKGGLEKTSLTVIVYRGDKISTITNQVLYKLSKHAQIKVIASGFTIVIAVRATLQVVTSGISKEPVSINAILASSVDRRDLPGKRVPAIQIYLEKGHNTIFPPRHAEVLAQITRR